MERICNIMLARIRGGVGVGVELLCSKEEGGWGGGRGGASPQEKIKREIFTFFRQVPP